MHSLKKKKIGHDRPGIKGGDIIKQPRKTADNFHDLVYVEV